MPRREADCVYKVLSTARRTLGHGGDRGAGEPNHGCTDLPAVGISLAPTHTANKGLPPHPQCPFLVRSPPLHSGTPPPIPLPAQLPPGFFPPNRHMILN